MIILLLAGMHELVMASNEIETHNILPHSTLLDALLHNTLVFNTFLYNTLTHRDCSTAMAPIPICP